MPRLSRVRNLKVAIGVNRPIFKRRPDLRKENLSIDVFPLRANINLATIDHTRENSTRLKNPSQQSHSIPLHPILKVGAEPHPQLLHMGIGRPRPDRDLVFLLHDIHEPHLLHPLLGAICRPVRLPYDLASLEDLCPPLVERMFFRDSPVLGLRVWAELVVLEPASWSERPLKMSS